MIFRRSLVNELANSAGGVFTVLFSIVLTVGLVQILGEAADGSVDSATVFELVAYSSLVNLPPLVALSLFMAVLMVLMRSWQDSEMVVQLRGPEPSFLDPPGAALCASNDSRCGDSLHCAHPLGQKPD